MALFHTKAGFLKAAAEGDVPRLEEYIKAVGPKICAIHEDYSGDTPLHKAAAAGHAAAVALLLKQEYPRMGGKGGAQDWYSEVNTDRCTALHKAAEKGHLEVVRLLLPVTVTHPELIHGMIRSDGRSPLSDAAENGHWDVVRALLAEKQHPPQGYPRKALYAAIRDDQVDILKEMIAAGPVDLTAAPPALYFAVQSNSPECVRYLLDVGANPNVNDNKSDYYPTYRQGYNHGHLDRNYPESPLFKAVLEKRDGIFDTLLQGGARFTRHESPLHFAAANGDVALAEKLLAQGVKIDAGNEFGQTALQIAVEKNHLPLVKFLLAQGADPQRPDAAGNTALSAAQRFLRTDMIALLSAKTQDSVAVAEAPAAAPPEKRAASPREPAASPSIAPAPALPAPAAGDDWALSGKSRLAHVYEVPGRRLTEVFNFETRERIVFSENLTLKTEHTGPHESFDAITEEALSQALAEFRKLGGSANDTDVFRNRLGKLKVGPT